MKKRIVGLSLALVLVGAGGMVPPPAGAEGAIVHSATGAGNFFTQDGHLRTFAFTVLEHADGSVDGQAQVRNPLLGTLRHFQLDCLSIRGNLAVASGTVTSAENPSLVGAPAVFAVQDNGQGASAPPDQVSPGVDVNRPFTCNTVPTSLALSVLRPIDAGNIQIR
jgi:hypothetical protein